MVKEHNCSGQTCTVCRAAANLPPTPAAAPKRRSSSPRIGQRDTHYNLEIQVLERVRELEQKAILSNLDHREEENKDQNKDEAVERAAFIDQVDAALQSTHFRERIGVRSQASPTI